MRPCLIAGLGFIVTAPAFAQMTPIITLQTGAQPPIHSSRLEPRRPKRAEAAKAAPQAECAVSRASDEIAQAGVANCDAACAPAKASSGASDPTAAECIKE